MLFSDETSGQDSKPYSTSFLPPESDMFDSMTDLPPDPLLDSGAFINTNVSSAETLYNDDINIVFEDHVVGESVHSPQKASADPVPTQVPEPSENVSGDRVVLAGGSEIETPVSEKSALPVKTPGRRGRRKKSEILAVDVSGTSPDSPDWLPPGWFIEDRVRASGVSAGARDKYYCDPVSGRKFRSRKEVLYFQETGGKPKRVLKQNTTDDIPTQIQPRSSSRKRKEKNVGSRSGKSSSKFDFEKVPEKIGWVLTEDSLEGSWTPFVGSKRVPETSKKEWAATFKSICGRQA